MPQSATVAKLELAHRMREYRAAARKTAKEIALGLDVSPNYVSALENGREVPSKEKLPAIARVYELNNVELDELSSLVNIARSPGWWEAHEDLLGPDLVQLCGLEHGASKILVYEGLIVTGLLQTEEYAAALIGSDPANSPAINGELVSIRMTRQRRLRGSDPIQLSVLLNQSAVMQQVGGSASLRRQLLHLRKLIDELEETLDLRIQPFEATLNAFASTSNLLIFEMPGARMGSLLWREAGIPLGVSHDHRLIDLMRFNFSEAYRDSLTRLESAELIDTRIAELSKN